jgi:hypothetical protein
VKEDDSGCFFLIIILAVFFAIIKFFNWVWEGITNWETLDTPYNYMAAFYYYIIAIPIKVGISIWGWLSLQSFTPYPNLNLSIGVLCVISYVVGIILIIRGLIKILDYFNYGAEVLFFLLIAPSIFGGAWFLLVALFSWFFALA